MLMTIQFLGTGCLPTDLLLRNCGAISEISREMIKPWAVLESRHRVVVGFAADVIS
jgi:hypothetical protein